MPTSFISVSTSTDTITTYTELLNQAREAAESAYQELDRVTSARVHRATGWGYNRRAVSAAYDIEPPAPQRIKKLSAFSLLVLKEKEIKEKL